MSDYAILLDAPREPRTRVQIAKLGDDFHHGKYGDFSITPDDVAEWKRNLAHLPGKRALIDLDHQADRVPRNTEAAGWITNVDLDGDTPIADVEWTPKGKTALEEGRYLFISPTYGDFKDEHGTVHKNTLIGAALTNRPFLNMPTLTLASEERVSEAASGELARLLELQDGRLLDQLELSEKQTALLTLLDVSQAERDRAKENNNSLPDGSYPINSPKQLHAAAVLAASKHGDWQAAKRLIRRRAKELGVDVTSLPGFADDSKSLDSRAANMDTATLIKTLDLAEDADEAKILEALSELKTAADEAAKLQKKLDKKPVKTLEQQAEERGLKVLDGDTLTKLLDQAAKGEQAMKELHNQRFENAFEKALNDSKGPRVKPDEHDSLKYFYTLDADATIKMIEDREPLVPARPSTEPAIDLSELDADAPVEQLLAARVHPDSHTLDQRIRKHMLDNKLPDSDYVKIFEQVQTGEVRV